MLVEQTVGTRIHLKAHATLSRTTLTGKPALGIGLLFLIVGLLMLFMGMEWIGNGTDSIHGSLWILGVGGGLCAGIGLWLFVYGLHARRRMRNINDGKQLWPESPWLWDYPWQAWGVTDNYLKSALRSFGALIVFSLGLAPVHWIAFSWEEESFFLQGIVGLLDLVIILSVGDQFITKLKQYFIFGNSQLAFHEFPFFLGNPISLTLKNIPANISTLHLTLRCIEEAYLEEEITQGNRSVITCFQIYHDTQILERENLQCADALDIFWVLPKDQTLSSTPCEQPATYWELEVTADRPDVNYQSRFLLPIYAQHDAPELETCIVSESP